MVKWFKIKGNSLSLVLKEIILNIFRALLDNIKEEYFRVLLLTSGYED